MKRRSLLLGLLAAPLALPAFAQPRKPLLALLLPGAASGPQASPWPVPLRKALAGLGWEEGRNIDIVSRFADDDFTRLPELAAELVALNPDIILTHVVAGARAAAGATRAIPIVVGAAGEDALIEIAGGLARPSRNVTGQTVVSHEQTAKCVELLKQIYPAANRIGLLVNAQSNYHRNYPAQLAGLIGPSAIEWIRADARNIAGLDAAFDALAAARADAVLVTLDPLFLNPTMDRRINDLARERKIVVAGMEEGVARAGGLLSFGTDYQALIRRSAVFVDKILKGAKPGDLPVERPSIFKMVVNLKAAEALGISISPILLGRADEIIE